MDDCIFCKIAKGEIPSDIVLKDDVVMVIRDIDPKAPQHLLAIPIEHIDSCADINDHNSAVVARLFTEMACIAREGGFEDGFRIVSNTGESAGQSVKHLHFHLLAGRDFGWPPG